MVLFAVSKEVKGCAALRRHRSFLKRVIRGLVPFYGSVNQCPRSNSNGCYYGSIFTTFWSCTEVFVTYRQACDIVTKKRTFSADIATAYPEEAKVKSWVRSYTLGDNKLSIQDVFALKEAVAPNQINFLSWGKITFPSAGKIRIEVKGQKVEISYPAQFKPELETIKLDDVRLSKVWGTGNLPHHAEDG